MDKDGHILLPGILTPETCERLMSSFRKILDLTPSSVESHKPAHYAAEYDSYLESLIPHPQLLDLARKVLGKEIRFDHCVTIIRPGGNGGTGWHSHEYAEDDPSLGFVRIFFYVSGFEAGDGGLRAVPGSHLYRDAKINADTDEALKTGWMAGKTHPMTGEPPEIQDLSAPAGSVVLMWTHAAHAVSPRRANSDTRWGVVYAYRNPGQTIAMHVGLPPEFERKRIPGAKRTVEPLLSHVGWVEQFVGWALPTSL